MALSKRKKRLILLLYALSAALLTTIVVVLMVVLINQQNDFRHTFISRCEGFEGYDCKKLWKVFQQAYVGKSACKVPVEAYDPLLAEAPIQPACNRMMFWSRSKQVVHDFTEKTDCFITLEDTLLGSVLDGLSWCGKENSKETFTNNCPGWDECENNPVRSFWKKASAEYAHAACGGVTAMLNGSISPPYNSSSIFASVEVPRLNSTRVNSLTVVLVTQENSVSNCTNGSFEVLQKDLDEGIKYKCKEVALSWLQKCGSKPNPTCGPCW
ncbi:ADP-ribosyl cyclase/cyclic ADP-ribose hydrolase 1-like [Cynoglossus semilaevis]|uniref:ADP-ribosyl cyclase/cyclic ADP-ribose hydrolase n=1 Tax=Cynoglossus semilaevis TaxID=244447 RepID=A0A3P8WSA2_CYNSE|nr:ADP-ribosyl cyclase/cyclic ADP-ribose hydrolase 1-like [Cynoglossus semilaevis]